MKSIKYTILASFLHILIIDFYFTPALFAQSSSLKFDRSLVDLGIISTAVNPPKIIRFLLVEKSTDITVRFERRFYSPGEEGIINIFYNPRNTGIIKEEIRIFNNLDTFPQIIQLSGKVISVLECFPDPDNLLKRNIDVIDSITREPVPYAQLKFIHNHNTKNGITIKVNKEGKATQELPIGLYNMSVTAEKYHNLEKEFFLPKSQPVVTVEMSPLTVKTVFENTPSIQPEIIIKENQVIYTELPSDKYAANNIILLLDVSSSMKNNKKFLLLQQAVNNLVMILRPFDYVSLITYSSEAKTILQSVPGNEKEKIIQPVESLVPYGITKGVKGLKAAYSLAQNNFIEGGNNIVILATDGEFSETNIPDSYYEEMISAYANQQINLTIFGFGVNEDAIKRMKKMTQAGNGSFILVESEAYAKDILIDEIKKRSQITK
jgi:hypothetical protein